MLCSKQNFISQLEFWTVADQHVVLVSVWSQKFLSIPAQVRWKNLCSASGLALNGPMVEWNFCTCKMNNSQLQRPDVSFQLLSWTRIGKCSFPIKPVWQFFNRSLKRSCVHRQLSYRLTKPNLGPVSGIIIMNSTTWKLNWGVTLIGFS